MVSFSNSSNKKNKNNPLEFFKSFFKTKISKKKLLKAQAHLPNLGRIELGNKICNCMVCQGITLTPDYILITAYCGINKYKSQLKIHKIHLINQINLKLVDDEPVHNSCIFVYSRNGIRPRHIATLGLSDINHVGGISYDGESIWIAKSSNKGLSRISISNLESSIEKAINSKNNFAKISYDNELLDCGFRAGFVTNYGGLVWVGFYSASVADDFPYGILKGFRVNSTLSLEEVCTIKLPRRSQGASFYEHNGKRYLFVNLSGGRKINSRICVFDASSIKIPPSSGTSASKNTKPISLPLIQKLNNLPPLLEENAIDGDSLYTVFESSSPLYASIIGNRSTRVMPHIYRIDPTIFF